LSTVLGLYAMPGYLPDSDANLLQAVINKAFKTSTPTFENY